MSSEDVCDKCNRRITDGNSPVTINVVGDEDNWFDGEDTYDFHQSCWKKIRALFKK